MAIVTITYDTNEKMCDIEIDGKKQQDVCEVTISKYEDTAYITLTKVKNDEENKIYERTTLYANNMSTCKTESVPNIDNLANKLCKAMSIK